MGKIIDISQKLNLDETTFTFGEKSYKVDTTQKGQLLLAALQKDIAAEGSTLTDEDVTFATIAVFLGEDAAQEIKEHFLKLPNYSENIHTVLYGVCAAAMGMDYDEAVARFQAAARA